MKIKINQSADVGECSGCQGADRITDESRPLVTVISETGFQFNICPLCVNRITHAMRTYQPTARVNGTDTGAQDRG